VGEISSGGLQTVVLEPYLPLSPFSVFIFMKEISNFSNAGMEISLECEWSKWSSCLIF
jgi:hypothetical protein